MPLLQHQDYFFLKSVLGGSGCGQVRRLQILSPESSYKAGQNEQKPLFHHAGNPSKAYNKLRSIILEKVLHFARAQGESVGAPCPHHSQLSGAEEWTQQGRLSEPALGCQGQRDSLHLQRWAVPAPRECFPRSLLPRFSLL